MARGQDGPVRRDQGGDRRLSDAAASGIVTDIQRFSVHDGPGIRTTVFLKGCNLRCWWCHNPETLRAGPELQVWPERCIGCRACADVCKAGAHRFSAEGHIYDRGFCTSCGRCASACFAEGLVLIGRSMTVDEVVAAALLDVPFYGDAGGVTVSGGEPVCQADFARAVLSALRAHRVRTAVETNLAWPWDRGAGVIAEADLVMFDVKCSEDDLHRAGSGAGNAHVLANLRRLAETGVPCIARTPVVPGFNDTPEEIAQIAGLVAVLDNLLYYELLPFHPLGEGKYASLGLTGRAEGLRSPTRERMRMLASAARERGIPVRIAGDPLA
jgi:pyruvate formate lyase activating enzyme